MRICVLILFLITTLRVDLAVAFDDNCPGGVCTDGTIPAVRLSKSDDLLVDDSESTEPKPSPSSSADDPQPSDSGSGGGGGGGGGALGALGALGGLLGQGQTARKIKESEERDNNQTIGVDPYSMTGFPQSPKRLAPTPAVDDFKF